MKKRIFALLLCAVMLTAAGCGSKPLKSDVSEMPAEATDAATTAGDTRTASAATSAAAASTPDTVTGTSGDSTTAAAASTVSNESSAAQAAATAAAADPSKPGEAGTAPAPPETPVAPTDSAPSPAGSNGGNESGKLHITVETVEITLDELKEKDYTVPVLVTLDKNPGITYSEWGLKLDNRCTYKADTKGTDFATVFYINDAKSFLWTAWTSGAELADYAGTLLCVNVTLPSDAQPGTAYTLEYADWSLADAPHLWQSSDTNWVEANEVGWTNGGVVVK